MVEFRWIIMSLFLMLLFGFSEAAEQHSPSFTVRAGHEVTLPCENVIEGQQKCGYTVWIFNGRNTAAVELIIHGQKKSDRLSVTENCSLVIKKVTAEDVGRYSCRQFINSGGKQPGPDSQVNLYVVKIQEHLNILYCSVLTYEGCGHTVKWLYEGNKNDVETSQSSCSASVTFKTTHLNHKSNNYELLKCHVTDKKSGQVLVFPFSSQSSGCSVLDYIMLVMRVAELLLITVITVLLIRAAGNQRPPDDNTVHHDGGGHDGTVNYENVGDSSASVRLH